MADAYAQAKITVTDNHFYDESGAIASAGRLFGNTAVKNSRSVFFAEGCGESCRQCCAWNYEGDVPASGYGLARAYSNLVFSLETTGKFEAKLKKVPEYSAQKTRLLEEADRADKMGQLEQYLHSRTINRTGENKGKDGWMI
jgi:hypothetical protein